MAISNSEDTQLTTERGQEWVVGLDLGTTNSAIAYAPIKTEELHSFEIMQRISDTQVAPRRVLPSFLYLPGAHELPEGALTLPWDNSLDFMVGEYARVQGSRIPGRVVTSAKSWLAHRRVEPSEPMLPWESLKDSRKISALEASRQYLTHMRQAWDHAHPDSPLALQHLVLTVPASFDEIARELTIIAADQANLERVTLVEEPQAAFYAWLWSRQKTWRKELKGVDSILICDIGGGTTDFSVIKVGEQSLERVAVGDHLLLGGDNIDIAIAHLVEPRLGGHLDLLQWGVLRHECRRAKELLLGLDAPESVTITVPGSGSRLMAAAKTALVTAAEVTELVFSGFFPEIDFNDPVQTNTRTALREWGLPYASDAAIPRHLADFLRRNQLKPNAILFNGGACQPANVKKRLATILGNWTGAEIHILDNQAPDLAVAQGAAAFGWLKLHGRERITGGIARSFYLSVGHDKSVCVIHRNQDEDEMSVIDKPVLKLVIGRPVSFPLFAATDRPADSIGDIVDQANLKQLGSLETVIAGLSSGQQEAAVTLSAQVTEIGTMALWAKALSGGQRWALQLPLRGRKQAPTHIETPPAILQKARQLVSGVFNSKPNKTSADAMRPRTLLASIEEHLGPRDSWQPSLTRALWESFFDTMGRRRCDPEFEAAWFNGAGFCLRPGLGYPLDAWRVKQMETLIGQWLQFSSDERVRKEWWIFWRRLAAGLETSAQVALWVQMAPRLIPGRRHLKSRIKTLIPSEITEFTRLAVCLERIPLEEKELLGQLLLEKFKPRAETAWQIARLGARHLAGGGPQHVLPPEVVEPWVQRFLTCRWSDTKSLALALTDLARYTGERSLDLSESLREKVAQRLRQEGMPQQAKAVLEVVELEAEDRARFLGESLPLGLRL